MPDIFTEQSQQSSPPAHPDDAAIQSVHELLQKAQQGMGLFAAYSLHPKGVQFANQEPDERVLVFVRQHFITNVPWIINTILLLIIPPILFSLAQLVTVFPFSIPVGLGFSITIFYYLIVLGYAFSKFVFWFYNIGVVTQKRLVDLDTEQILSHNTATAGFSELVDVKFTQQGFFQSFFDYGDIHIQTEAFRANFEFLKCPKPTEVTDIINDLRVAMKGGHNGHA
jgi:hypothetical protein